MEAQCQTTRSKACDWLSSTECFFYEKGFVLVSWHTHGTQSESNETSSKRNNTRLERNRLNRNQTELDRNENFIMLWLQARVNALLSLTLLLRRKLDSLKTHLLNEENYLRRCHVETQRIHGSLVYLYIYRYSLKLDNSNRKIISGSPRWQLTLRRGRWWWTRRTQSGFGLRKNTWSSKKGSSGHWHH